MEGDFTDFQKIKRLPNIKQKRPRRGVSARLYFPSARAMAARAAWLAVVRRTVAAHDEGTPLGQAARAAIARADGK